MNNSNGILDNCSDSHLEWMGVAGIDLLQVKSFFAKSLVLEGDLEPLGNGKREFGFWELGDDWLICLGSTFDSCCLSFWLEMSFVVATLSFIVFWLSSA